MRINREGIIWVFLALFPVINPAATRVRASDAGTAPTIPEYGLLLSRTEQSVDRSSRRSSYFGFDDPVHSKLVDGTLSQFSPAEDEAVRDDGRLRWKRVEFGDNGGIKERGLYLYAPVVSDRRRAAILDSASHGELYINGEPRAANVYGRNYFHVPVMLKKGTNHLLLRAGRGSFKVRLYDPPAPVFLNGADVTLPDLVVGRKVNTAGAIVVVNATPRWTRGFKLALKGPGMTGVETPVPPVGPLSIRKVRFRISGAAPEGEEPVAATLELLDRKGELSHSIPLGLKVVQADRPRKVTFISKIDGSVQYFSLRPATPSADDPRPAIVLSCHGAAVKAHRQAGSYSSKDWFHIVAPTNRRPFGYDWEDFGRMDAMEALDIVKRSQRHDPSRIYVTGHSMGGHGAWHLGVTYPDKFAAVGPSAGWLSRSTYGRRRGEETEQAPMELLLRRPRKAGDTVALAANLKQHGVYILHGANDDNVPVSQARRMSEVLGEFHKDWDYHEQPGKKHWWSNEYGDGGAACLDWPFMFDMFARHAIPPSSAVREVEFVTANPGVSSKCHWLAIEGQIRHQDISKAHIHTWPVKRIFKGTTENVAVLRLDVGHLRSEEPITIDLDGQEITDVPYPETAGALWLERKDDKWHCIEKPPAEHKGPRRYGSIKDELKHRFLFVYGTAGTEEENARAFGKARYDAETFWYRGNGSIDIIRDSAFDPARYADRTVVLYGNADTNSAWASLLGESPVQVRRGRVDVGSRSFRGDDLSAYFIQPRKDSHVASVIAVSGSGPAGMRSTYSVSFFKSFVRYPDCLITRVDREDSGDSENVAVGFFGLDWSVENGEFEFADET